MDKSDYRKCELLEALKSGLKAADRRGCKAVSIGENDMLEIMRYDQEGGLNELDRVLDKIDIACACRHDRYTENHTKHVAFTFTRSGFFA
jgi:hypothetical protein